MSAGYYERKIKYKWPNLWKLKLDGKTFTLLKISEN